MPSCHLVICICCIPSIYIFFLQSCDEYLNCQGVLCFPKPFIWALTSWVFGEELNEEQAPMLSGTSMEVSPHSSFYDLHCWVWFVTQQNDSGNICLFAHWNTVFYSAEAVQLIPLLLLKQLLQNRSVNPYFYALTLLAYPSNFCMRTCDILHPLDGKLLLFLLLQLTYRSALRLTQ